MAKDDYFVIVYKILAYLYKMLKSGGKVSRDVLSCDGVLFQIEESYWSYILNKMDGDGLIEGIHFVKADGLAYPYPIDVTGCTITPKGIEYLQENGMMAKAKETIQTLKGIKELLLY